MSDVEDVRRLAEVAGCGELRRALLVAPVWPPGPTMQLRSREGTIQRLPLRHAPPALHSDSDDENDGVVDVPAYSSRALHAAVMFWVTGSLRCSNALLLELCELGHWAESDALVDAAAKLVAAGLCDVEDAEAAAFVQSLHGDPHAAGAELGV